MIVLHQLIPRGRRDVPARPTARQGHVLPPIPRYPRPAWCADVAQPLVIRRWHVAHRRWHASARLFRGCVRIVRALQIRVRDSSAAAEHVRNALHDARLSPTCNIPSVYFESIFPLLSFVSLCKGNEAGFF